MKKNISLVASIIIGAFIFYLYDLKIRQDESDFALYGLVREGAIYTLLGSKPLSQFATCFYPAASGSDTSTLILNEPVTLDRSKLTYTEKKYFNKDIFNLWSIWKRRHKLSGKTISLVCVSGNQVDCLFLVNKPLVKKKLQENYDLFSKSIKKEFDVDKVVREIDDSKSLFWTHMVNYKYGHICMGLLFDFGLENTLEFQKYTSGNREKGACLNEDSLEEISNRFFSPLVSINNLSTPCYVSFSNPDPVLEYYKKERIRIQEEYKDADLRQLLIDALEK